jgi:hypothetical protein
MTLYSEAWTAKEGKGGEKEGKEIRGGSLEATRTFN